MYFALSKEARNDKRVWRNHPLRLTIPLTFLAIIEDGTSISNGSRFYMCQAVTSIAITVYDKRLWDGVCLNDEYYMEESLMEDPAPSWNPIEREEDLNPERFPPGLRLVQTDTADPIIGQEAGQTPTDPRVYSLRFLVRTLQYVSCCAQELHE